MSILNKPSASLVMHLLLPPRFVPMLRSAARRGSTHHRHGCHSSSAMNGQARSHQRRFIGQRFEKAPIFLVISNQKSAFLFALLR
jgi:hypothetical protein